VSPFQIPFSRCHLRREAPKELAAAEFATALEMTGGEILRGSAAQDDTHDESSIR
jgi:hypothetical protein